MSWTRDVTTFIMLVPVLLTLVYWGRLGKGKIYLWLSLFCMLVVNIVSYILRRAGIMDNTTPLFVLFVNFLSFLLFYLYYLKILVLPRTKLIQKILIGVFILVFGVMSLVYKQSFFYVFPIYFYFFEIVLLLVSITLFLYESFNSDIILGIKTYFPFWVSMSLIVLFVGLVPVLLFVNSVDTKVSWEVYSSLVFFINLIGYGILSYGTVRSRKTDNL